MIEEIGTVVELKSKGRAVVLCKKSSMCENCATSGACSLGEDNHSRTVEVLNLIGAGVGDKVRIATDTKNFLQSSFFLYIVPLIALVIGAAVGGAVGNALPLGIDPNLLSAVFGVFFLVGSFLIIRVGSSALQEDTFMPKITAVLAVEEKGSATRDVADEVEIGRHKTERT